MKKQLVILGSSGSIGRSALDVAGKNSDRIEVVGLSVHSNIELLAEQIRSFRPRYVAVTDRKAYQSFRASAESKETRLLDPGDGIDRLAMLEQADIVLNAIVGAAGLKASLDAVSAGKRLALANKESMVIGGPLLKEAARKSGAEIVPVDSEHSAIWQALASGKYREIRRIILTGSGGPFRERHPSEFGSITKDQALKHPTWKMGSKITIDSATMMNKGLEIIEAMHLFDVPSSRIEVVIHPQSIIHSMVEFVDSSIIAQMSNPDMRLPIAYALFYPERVASGNGQVDLTDIKNLSFSKPDFEKFPLLKLAYRVSELGGTAPAVYNSSNEVAVDAFLNDAIEFSKISDIVLNAVEKHVPVDDPSYDDIIAADQQGREMAKELMR